MILVEFVNDMGRVHLHGDGRGPWNITDITGLGLTTKAFNVVTYPGQQGQQTISAVNNARIITIKGDIYTEDGSPAHFLLPKAMKVLNVPGQLIVHGNTVRRKINAHCTAFEQGERNGPYHSFVIQFTCDNPFFEGYKATQVSVFYRENLIKQVLKLPMVFSRRVSRADINNIGDVDTEPVFIIQTMGVSDSGSNDGIEIINHTTNQRILLEYNPSIGETVRVDIPERKIYNDAGVNLIDKISLDTFLSDFWLQTGRNDVEVINHAGPYCSVLCEYTNKYIEAVI